MKTKIFIAFTHSSENEELILKKMHFKSKEYRGLIVDKDLITLNEIESLAKKHGQELRHTILLPILLFG